MLLPVFAYHCPSLYITARLYISLSFFTYHCPSLHITYHLYISLSVLTYCCPSFHIITRSYISLGLLIYGCFFLNLARPDRWPHQNFADCHRLSRYTTCENAVPCRDFRGIPSPNARNQTKTEISQRFNKILNT